LKLIPKVFYIIYIALKLAKKGLTYKVALTSTIIYNN